MIRIFASMALLLAAHPAGRAEAQQQDSALVRRGREIWHRKECAACHGIQTTHGGPALGGVTRRRTREWLYEWMRDSRRMVESDSIGRALKQAYKATMPSQRMSRRDVDALLAFIEAAERDLLEVRRGPTDR